MSKEELFKLPTGSKITTDLENDNVFTMIHRAFINKSGNVIGYYDIEDDLSINVRAYGAKIIKIECPDYETIYNDLNMPKKMTINEISKALGYKIEVIKEDK